MFIYTLDYKFIVVGVLERSIFDLLHIFLKRVGKNKNNGKFL